MKVLKGLVPWLPTILLCLLGLGAWSFSAIRFTGYVLLGIAFVTVLYRLCRLLSRKKPKEARMLHCLLTVSLSILVLAAAITEGCILYAASGSRSGKSDYLIVLGAGVNGTTPSLSLSDRLRAAYDYLTENPDTLCVVSGGQGPGEDISEAECMYRYLTQRGISPDRILKEDQSTSTRENLRFSMALLETHTGAAPAQAAILSSEYHLFRAGLMAKDQGLDPILVPAQTSWLSLRVNYCLREIAGVWYYMIFGG